MVESPMERHRMGDEGPWFVSPFSLGGGCPVLDRASAAEEMPPQAIRELAPDAPENIEEEIKIFVTTAPTYPLDSERQSTKDASHIASPLDHR